MMPFPLVLVCHCFNAVVSVAVEVAGYGPRSRVMCPP